MDPPCISWFITPWILFISTINHTSPGYVHQLSDFVNGGPHCILEMDDLLCSCPLFNTHTHLFPAVLKNRCVGSSRRKNGDKKPSTFKGIQLYTRWCPSSLAKLVCKSKFTMVYRWHIYIVNGITSWRYHHGIIQLFLRNRILQLRFKSRATACFCGAVGRSMWR